MITGAQCAAALAAVLCAGPATAWEFTETERCIVSHQTTAARVWVIFDPAIPEYTFVISLENETWPDAAPFGIAFLGGRPLSIQTDRHVVTDEGHSLSVTDQGFGNVLDGLQFNDIAVATLGNVTVTIPLDDAAGPVQAFRACPSLSLS